MCSYLEHFEKVEFDDDSLVRVSPRMHDSVETRLPHIEIYLKTIFSHFCCKCKFNSFSDYKTSLSEGEKL